MNKINALVLALFVLVAGSVFAQALTPAHTGAMTIKAPLTFTATTTFSGAVVETGTKTISGATTFHNTTTLASPTTVSGTLGVSGVTTVSGTTTFNNTVSLASASTAANGKTIVGFTMGSQDLLIGSSAVTITASGMVATSTLFINQSADEARLSVVRGAGSFVVTLRDYMGNAVNATAAIPINYIWCPGP